MLEDILSQVNKPGRYIGREWNLPKKDYEKAEIKFALCFPDLYEVGMSNLGVRIIYSILNSIPYVACERFFSPGLDLENNLRNKHMNIFSLESQRELAEFDMIGFSLGHELCYTNVLNILDLGSIPLKSSLRGYNHPLVIGGGPCALNPEPMHDFFDIFVIGEAEDAIIELIDAYRKLKKEFKTSRIDKTAMLVALSNIEGVYAPSLYEEKYAPEGKIKAFRPKAQGVPVRVKKRIVKNLDKARFPSSWLVPFIQIVHDRITLEVMRGCPNRCRFCQARQQYFPLRQKSVKNILEAGLETYKLTGYEEIALGGLSVSDYARIEELLTKLSDSLKNKCVSLSLPSIKPTGMVGRLSSLIATVKKTGLTFAPEAATVKLRNILAKDFDTHNFFKAIEEAYLCGYQHVKLYFMIGLPAEEEADLDGIINFAVRLSELRRKIKQHPAQVNLSINALIPKPHTPLQWFKMQDLESIRYKQDYIRKQTGANKRIKLNFHNRYMSFLEGVLSRGDRRLSRVIVTAFNAGARFDAWGDRFKFETWIAAFKESNLDPCFYLKARSKDELLPWDFIDLGISRESLLAEFNKASKAAETYCHKIR